MNIPAHPTISKRPASVTTLMWLVVVPTVWNATRLGASITKWDLLADFASPPGPAYIAGSGVFWVVCGLGILLLIHRRNQQARLAAAAFAIAYAIWWWTDRLLIQPETASNWPFNLTLTGILLVLTAYLIFNRKTIAHLSQRERHEQKNASSDIT